MGIEFYEDDPPVSDIIPTDVIKSEWEVDGDVPSRPPTDHYKKFTWKPALLRFDFSYESFWGANVALPKSDSDNEFCSRHQTDDRSNWTHWTYETDTAYLSVEQLDSNIRAREQEKEEQVLPQATNSSDDTREVLMTPEIDFNFCDEPIIELASFY